MFVSAVAESAWKHPPIFMPLTACPEETYMAAHLQLSYTISNFTSSLPCHPISTHLSPYSASHTRGSAWGFWNARTATSRRTDSDPATVGGFEWEAKVSRYECKYIRRSALAPASVITNFPIMLRSGQAVATEAGRLWPSTLEMDVWARFLSKHRTFNVVPVLILLIWIIYY